MNRIHRALLLSLMLAPATALAQTLSGPPPAPVPKLLSTPTDAAGIIPPRRFPVRLVWSVSEVEIPARSAPFHGRTRASAATRPGDGGDRVRWRPALMASAALAVTGALVAHWSTDQADAAYDRYLKSAGSRRQEAALDRAERYDRVAGAGFAAMEVGLVLSAYFVFF